MTMVIGKRSIKKWYRFQESWIAEWDCRINGMDYYFVAWFTCNDEGGAEQLMHIFIYPKSGPLRMIKF